MLIFNANGRPRFGASKACLRDLEADHRRLRAPTTPSTSHAFSPSRSLLPKRRPPGGPCLDVCLRASSAPPPLGSRGFHAFDDLFERLQRIGLQRGNETLNGTKNRPDPDKHLLGYRTRLVCELTSLHLIDVVFKGETTAMANCLKAVRQYPSLSTQQPALQRSYRRCTLLVRTLKKFDAPTLLWVEGSLFQPSPATRR